MIDANTSDGYIYEPLNDKNTMLFTIGSMIYNIETNNGKK